MVGYDWVYLFAALATVISFVGTILAKILKAQTEAAISGLVTEYLSELKPNHGSSLRDEVKSIQRDLTEVRLEVANLEGKFAQHIKENV